MRAYLVVFLLAILPLQFAWGVAAGYCGHEAGTGTAHFGHHEHQQRSVAAKSSPDAKLKIPADGDDDCLVCHLSPVQLASETTPQLEAPITSRPAPPNPSFFRSHVPIGPERPDRLLAS